jgi:hypothetical protein
MTIPSFRKTAVAAALAGTFAAAVPAEAEVMNFSWSGAFTMLSPAGSPVRNSPSDYVSGFYANGDGSIYTSSAPAFPANVGPNADCTTYAPACVTAHGWYGHRTPVSGTMSLDTSTGAGVGTVNPFYFFGDTPGTGPATTVAQALGVTFQVIDTVGTMIGSMLFSWNGLGHSISIVLDASGMLASLGTVIQGGPTSTISGVGALPATNGMNMGTIKFPVYLPLGPTPGATTTLNTGEGCDGLTLATQVNAYTIVTNLANVGICTTGMSDDGIGGDPMTSAAFTGFNANFDIMSVHWDTFTCLPDGCPPPIPLPPAVWLFGSGLLGLIGLARRKKKAG